MNFKFNDINHYKNTNGGLQNKTLNYLLNSNSLAQVKLEKIDGYTVIAEPTLPENDFEILINILNYDEKNRKINKTISVINAMLISKYKNSNKLLSKSIYNLKKIGVKFKIVTISTSSQPSLNDITYNALLIEVNEKKLNKHNSLFTINDLLAVIKYQFLIQYYVINLPILNEHNEKPKLKLKLSMGANKNKRVAAKYRKLNDNVDITAFNFFVEQIQQIISSEEFNNNELIQLMKE